MITGKSRLICAFSGLAALAAATSPASAAELLIAAPSACAIGDDLSFRAERALGQSLASAADVRCTVHITRDGAAYAARLEVSAIASPEPTRLRSFSAPSCEMLTETLALAVSLAIASGTPEPEPVPSGSGATRELSPSAQLSAAHAVDAVEGTGELDAARPASGDARGPRFGASAALVADAGTLPGVGLGVSLGASLGIDAFELSLLGTYLPARSVSSEAAPLTSPVAEIELLAGSLLACVPRLVRASELAFGACAGAELGWMAGRGTGVDVARSGGSWWTAGRADAGARWTLAPGLGLEARLSALVPWQRDEFAVSGVGRVFRAGAVVGRATLGLSYELGAESE